MQEIAAERFVGARRRQALEWLLERAPPMADEELDAFMRELRGV